MPLSSGASHCLGVLDRVPFLFPTLPCCWGAESCCWHQEIPYGFAFCLMAAVAVFTALPVPISGRPINPDIMVFPCKRQFVKICLWAAVTISMGFISSLFTVCAHVYAALLSHHNPKLDCPLDLLSLAASAEQVPGLPLSCRLIFNFIFCFEGWRGMSVGIASTLALEFASGSCSCQAAVSGAKPLVWGRPPAPQRLCVKFLA